MNFYRVVNTGFSDTEMPPLAPDEDAVRVHDRLTDDEYRLLADRLAARPDAWLHLFDRSPDVECLRLFPGLRRQNAAAYDVLPLGAPPYGHADWSPNA